MKSVARGDPTRPDAGFSWRRLRVVLGKELTDNLRDKRSLSMALMLPLFAPLSMIGLMVFVADVTQDEAAKELRVPAQGIDQAPLLVDYLLQRNIRLVPEPADVDLEAAVAERRMELALVIPPGYAADFAAGKPATVRLVLDESRTASGSQSHRLSGALSSYARQVGALRLLARGVSPEVVSALAIEEADQASPQSRGAIVIGPLIMFLIMTIFMAGAYVAIDVTAGERERGSLEPLLANPLQVAELVLGKLGAVLVFTSASFLALIAAVSLALALVPLEVPGMRLGWTPLAVGQLALILTPLLFLSSSLHLVVASASRTFKEAQTTMSFVALVPLVPSFLQTMNLLRAPSYVAAIPIYAQTVQADRALRGDAFAGGEWALAAAITLALGVALTVFLIARYDRQRALFR